VSFTCSARWITDVDKQQFTPYGPYQSGYEDGVTARDGQITKVKKDFERHNSELFTTPYLDSKVTDEEKEFFEALSKDKKTDHVALRLVQAALGM
jgi:hypothetical protein